MQADTKNNMIENGLQWRQHICLIRYPKYQIPNSHSKMHRSIKSRKSRSQSFLANPISFSNEYQRLKAESILRNNFLYVVA